MDRAGPEPIHHEGWMSVFIMSRWPRPGRERGFLRRAGPRPRQRVRESEREEREERESQRERERERKRE